MICDLACGFAQSELHPRAIKAFMDETDVPELFPMLGRVELQVRAFRKNIAAEGTSHVARGSIALKVVRADIGHRSAASVGSSLVVCPIYASARESSANLSVLQRAAREAADRHVKVRHSTSLVLERAVGFKHNFGLFAMPVGQTLDVGF